MAKYLIDNRQEPVNFSAKGLERTVQNCKNLLMCRTGEVPYDRRRGVNAQLFDRPIDYLNARLLPEMERTMALCNPEAKLANARAYLDADGGLMIETIVDIEEG